MSCMDDKLVSLSYQSQRSTLLSLDDDSILGVEGRGGTTAAPCHTQEEKKVTTD